MKLIGNKNRSGLAMWRFAMSSVGVAALCAPGLVFAQVDNTSVAPQKADTLDGVDDIVVTARREAENLQDVPVSVQVVTGEVLQQQAINRAEDISKFTPGLRITGPTDNSGGLIILRGVRWSGGSGTEAIPVYLNDLSFQPGAVLQGLFDVQQIEVLRGPQGTTRGAPSIAGAVTITSRTPDLDEVGGYASGLLGTRNTWFVQGAVNVPIVKDKLAIRVAGMADHSLGGNRVRSTAPGAPDPDFRTRNVRATALFEPGDGFSLKAMYQYQESSGNNYIALAGPGAPGVPARGIGPNFNGPPLRASDYRGVSDFGRNLKSSTQFVTLNATWDILGQRLSYNYGLQLAGRGGAANVDVANMIPGFDTRNVDAPRSTLPKTYYNVHEIRLSSIRDGSGFFDYDIGYYRQRSDGLRDITSAVFRPGTFGRPGTEVPGSVTTPVSRYILPINTRIRLATRNESIYGNVQLHLPADIEFTGGIRRISDRRPSSVNITSGAFNALFQNPTGGLFPCAAFGTAASPVYSGFCEAAVPAGVAFTSVSSSDKKYTPTIWNASLSRKFSDNVLAYATVGTSWRQGLLAIGNEGLPDNLLFPKPERATSYEIGVKTTIADSIRLNLDVFQIDYKGQLTTGEGVNYFNTVRQTINTTSIAFYTNVDARVRGVEAELFYRPVTNLSLGLNLSYAKIESQGGQVPCNDASRPLNAGNPINLCPSPKGKTLNVSSPFQATFNGNYTIPFDNFDGYVRFNVDFQGRNPNINASAPARGLLTRRTPAYAIVDLFAGLTGKEGVWELGLYSKNLFNKRLELFSQPQTNGIFPDFGPTGYDAIVTTLPREVGVTLRYAFGSR